MSRKQRQPVNDKLDAVDAAEFETLNLEIDLLMKRLQAKRVCPCRAAKGLMYRGAFLHEKVAGAADTVALCHDIADFIEHPDDARVSDTQH